MPSHFYFLLGTYPLSFPWQKTLSWKQTYPPEIVVLVTPNVPVHVYDHLCPALGTRIIPVEEWHSPSQGIDSKLGKKHAWKRTLDNHNPGWTKMRIFGLQQYDTILYIDSDCLVLKDVSSLLELNKVYTESESLIAAAPDLLPPHQFNSGVMVVRPSIKVFETIKGHAKLLTTYDGSDTGFLNAYFNTWNTEFPPMARLPAGYNAQQAMYDMTMDEKGGSSFWDVQVASDLYIVHYSNAVKPWESLSSSSENHSLVALWKTWYEKSNNFLTRHRKEERSRIRMENEQREEEKRQRQKAEAARTPSATGSASSNNPRQIHKLIAKRFKELRAQGLSGNDAMQQARAEYNQGDDDVQVDAGTQVAAMFGMR